MGRHGLHLLTMNTPTGPKVRIIFEDLKELYSIEWTKTLNVGSAFPIYSWSVWLRVFPSNVATKEQKKDWYLGFDPYDLSIPNTTPSSLPPYV